MMTGMMRTTSFTPVKATKIIAIDVKHKPLMNSKRCQNDLQHVQIGTQLDNIEPS
jgi:hypothetical protein